MSRLILFNKPYGVLSQFTAESGSPTLAEYIKVPGVYPAGRLDKDSEGLLLLTDNGKLQQQLSDPRFEKEKSYWVQLEGKIDADALKRLCSGVQLRDGVTLPARVASIDPPRIWERDPPIRFRANIPTCWINLTIREGRNRQVRRMTAAVGYPTLRLIRHQVGEWQLAELAPGSFRELAVDFAPGKRRTRRSPSSNTTRPRTRSRR